MWSEIKNKNCYLLTLIQNIDTTAINAPKNTAHAIPSTAISKDPMEPSEDEAELSVDGEVVFEEDEAEDPPEVLSDDGGWPISVCAPALTSNNPCRANFDLAVGNFVISALY